MKFFASRSVYVLAFLVVVSYAFFALRGPKGVSGLFEKRRQIEELQKRNAILAQEIEHKRAHIQRLSNNPAEQEVEIRQRLKLVHPGEKVYILAK